MTLFELISQAVRLFEIYLGNRYRYSIIGIVVSYSHIPNTLMLIFFTFGS